MSINEHDLVVLTRDLPEHGLRVGDVGTAVHVYGNAAGYEVEFITATGKTVAVVTLAANAIRPPADHEILHIRSVQAA